jgi:hypothetical protein
VAAAGLAAYLLARFVIPRPLAPLPSLLLHGGTVVVAYPLMLLALGFYHPAEIAVVRRLATRLRRRSVAVPTDESTELAGEIVQTAIHDEMIDTPEPETPNPDDPLDAPATPPAYRR